MLTLSHGNVDVERSLTVNKQATGTNPTLLIPESLNGIRQVKDAVAAEDGKIHIMDFHKKLMSCTRIIINERYRQRLDKRKKQEEARKNEKFRGWGKAKNQKQRVEEKAFQEKKRKLRQTEEDLQKEQEEHQFKLKAAEALLSEAKQRLADAIKSKDFNAVPVAQGLLEIAHTKMKTA